MNFDWNKYLVIALEFGLNAGVEYLKEHYFDQQDKPVADLEKEWESVQSDFQKMYFESIQK